MLADFRRRQFRSQTLYPSELWARVNEVQHLASFWSVHNPPVQRRCKGNGASNSPAPSAPPALRGPATSPFHVVAEPLEVAHVIGPEDVRRLVAGDLHRVGFLEPAPPPRRHRPPAR